MALFTDLSTILDQLVRSKVSANLRLHDIKTFRLPTYLIRFSASPASHNSALIEEWNNSLSNLFYQKRLCYHQRQFDLKAAMQL